MKLNEELASFEVQIESHLRGILDCASRSPLGGGHEWNEMLAAYQLNPGSALDRLTEVRRVAQKSGAALSEVRLALQALTARARQELELIGNAHLPPQPVGLPRALVSIEGFDTLRARLCGLCDEAMAHYAELVCPKKAPVAAVSQIFANARSTSAQSPSAGFRIDPTRVIECPQCGAPQEVVLDFTCRYCRGSLKG